ncbi:hypothetical protein HWV62_4595 [Athelia sp. TMB]|nr:hypothetical protein HWV62_4595 [Athelia sp. TMB]
MYIMPDVNRPHSPDPLSGALVARSSFLCLPLFVSRAAFWHPSMWGFNVTAQTFSYDNRPVSPLINYTFEQWWFHGHLDYPPNDGDIFELPAGQNAIAELACDKGATDFFATDGGGDIRDPNDEQNPCPGSPISEFHTTGIEDSKGCALAITYNDNVTSIQPEDFTVFSVNQTCVWYRNTTFQVPERMPPCPAGGCTCAWFWIHSPDSGSEQNYMNGFKCNVTGSTSEVALAQPQIPRRCGADPDDGKADAVPGNCTYGAKQPFYWFQAEENTMFEDAFHPPFYLDLYNFLDGAQNDIFVDSYVGTLPTPGPNQTVIPQLAQISPGGSGNSSTSTSVPSPTAGAPASAAPSATSSAGPGIPTPVTPSNQQQWYVVALSRVSPFPLMMIFQWFEYAVTQQTKR